MKQAAPEQEAFIAVDWGSSQFRAYLLFLTILCCQQIDLSLSDPHEIKPPMAEHQAAHGVLTRRPSWPPE